jgi:hypothetical protein
MLPRKMGNIQTRSKMVLILTKVRYNLAKVRYKSIIPSFRTPLIKFNIYVQYCLTANFEARRGVRS